MHHIKTINHTLMIEDSEYNRVRQAVQLTLGKSLPAAGTPGSIPVRKVLESLKEEWKTEGSVETNLRIAKGITRQAAMCNSAKPLLDQLEKILDRYESKSIGQIIKEIKELDNCVKSANYE